MERFVYNPKYAKLIIGVSGKKATIEELAKKNDINAGHLRTVIDQWSKEEVIFKEREGRDYHIGLTKKGEEISKVLAELMDLVRRYEPTIEEPEKVSDNKTTKTTKKVAKKATKLEVKKNDGTTTAATDTL